MKWTENLKNLSLLYGKKDNIVTINKLIKHNQLCEKKMIDFMEKNNEEYNIATLPMKYFAKPTIPELKEFFKV